MTRERATGSGAADEPFVRRWSRRKQAARERDETARDDGPDPASGQAAEGGPPAPAEPDERGSAPAAGDAGHDPAEAAPTDADMPPIESLDADSDYSGFMSPRVSESLRRMALRKLFGMPGFNIRDGLDDYDVDYTSFEPLGATVTADMKYHAERRRARQAELDAEAERDAGAAPPSGDEDIDVAAADTEAGADGRPTDRRDAHDQAPETPPDEARGDGEVPDDDR